MITEPAFAPLALIVRLEAVYAAVPVLMKEAVPPLPVVPPPLTLMLKFVLARLEALT